MTDDYYNSISEGYEELHREEQEKKLAIIKEHLEVKPEDSLLDVGCGTGLTTQFACKTTGADPAKKLIEKAKQNYPDKKWVVAAAEDLPFENDSFDVVISVTAIQNFSDIEKGISEMRRVGKSPQENGRFVFTFLRTSSFKEQIDTIIRKHFSVTEVITEDKDFIFFCTKEVVI